MNLPDGRPLLNGLDLDLDSGAALLVKGPSGSGKTTLLRSLAGLWPYVEGTIARPEAGEILFSSQRPYLPLGALRTALAYPSPAGGLGDDEAEQALRAVHLGHLAGRLDEEVDWSQTLSPGEQQRLAFGRILLARPKLAFLDETTSALDEGLEEAMYDLVHERLPECTIVSVGHRSTLRTLHTRATHPARRRPLGDHRPRRLTTPAAEGARRARTLVGFARYVLNRRLPRQI